MKIPSPFIPVRVDTHDLSHTVHVVGRDYTIGADGMITSLKSEGVELLASPVRIVSVEDGEESVWDTDYPENESESFIQSRSDAEAVICGAKAVGTLYRRFLLQNRLRRLYRYRYEAHAEGKNGCAGVRTCRR